jgi:hypothetical protein
MNSLPLPLKLTTETFALFLIGDGVASILQPRRHAALWRTSPLPLEKAGNYFENRPWASIALGAVEIGIGLWLASKQQVTLQDRIDKVTA